MTLTEFNRPGRLAAIGRYRWWSYLVLLLEVVVFHRRVLFYAKWSIPFDLRNYHLPLASQAAEALASGRLPQWDPYTYGGFPFYANVNTQLFYPLAWPAFLIAGLFDLDWLSKLLEWQTALHMFLGGAFAFGLMRRLAIGRGPALFGATIFQLGGYFASQAQHLGAMCGAAWLPLAWMSVLALGEKFSARRLAWLGIALSMSLLAGFPAIAIVVTGSTAILAVLLVVFRMAKLRLLIFVAAGCVWAAALSAIQLIPTLNLARMSVAALRAQWHMTGGVPPQALVSLVVPNYYHVFDPSEYSFPFNFTFMYVYCGLLGLILAGAAVALARERLQIVFAVLTVLCCAWMLGSNTPVLGRYYPYIPDFIRGPMYAEFAMAAFTLGVAVMAAYGAHRWIASRGRLALTGLVVVTAIDLTLAGSGRIMNTFRTIDDPAVGATHFEGSEEALAALRTLATATFPSARFDVVDASRNWATSANMMKIPTASGDEPLVPLRTLRVRSCFAEGPEWERFYRVSKADSRLLDLLNVRYLIASGPQSIAQQPQGIRSAGFAGKHFVFENSDVLPRFFLVSRVYNTSSFDESLDALCSPEFSPSDMAIVERPEPLDFPAGIEESGAVRVIDYKPEFVEIEVDAPAPALLVASETWYPGWIAEINGRETPIMRTNAAFRGLVVPGGTSRITMRFQPDDLFYGAWCSAAAWLSAIVLIFRKGAGEAVPGAGRE